MTPGESVAGSLLRLALLRSGLSQREFAQLAGTSASAVSSYLAGRRQPSVPQLYRLLAAAGYEPRVRLEPVDEHDEAIAAWEAVQPDHETWNETQRRWLERTP